MKKKIKSLTLEEVKKICDTYNGWNACRNCPLDTNNEDICKFHNLDKYGDEEIEVEENGLYERKIWKMNKLKKLFCRCNNSIKIISNRKGILQFGKCNKCDRYWLINTDINKMQRLSFDEYLDIKLDLDKLDNILGDNYEKED